MISPCLIPWVQKCDFCTWYFPLWEEFYSARCPPSPPRHPKRVMLFIFFKALLRYLNSQAFNKVIARDFSFWHPRTKQALSLTAANQHWQLSEPPHRDTTAPHKTHLQAYCRAPEPLLRSVVRMAMSHPWEEKFYPLPSCTRKLLESTSFRL